MKSAGDTTIPGAAGETGFSPDIAPASSGPTELASMQQTGMITNAISSAISSIGSIWITAVQFAMKESALNFQFEMAKNSAKWEKEHLDSADNLQRDIATTRKRNIDASLERSRAESDVKISKAALAEQKKTTAAGHVDVGRLDRAFGRSRYSYGAPA